MLKNKFLWLLIILAVAGYFIVPKLLGDGGGMMMQGGPMPVTVAPVIKKDITLWDEFSGRLTAVDNVQIRPRVAGQIESVHFEDGEQVKEGDLLFVIDPRPYKAAMAAAQAQYEQADSEFKRAAPLLEEKAISKREFEQRTNMRAAAQAELTQAKLSLGYTRVTAPISGKVGRREITPGNLVNIGEPVLTTIVSQDPIYVDFEVDEQRFLKFTASSEKLSDIPVELTLAGNTLAERKGHIHAFDNQLNTQTGSIRVRAIFDNEDGKLVPGMFGRVRIASGNSGPALLVADSAIGTDQSKKFVYLLSKDNTPVWQEVTLGPAHGRLRVVETGLEEGQTIIIKGVRMIRPGMPVKPTVTDMDASVSEAAPATEEAVKEPEASGEQE